jgi:hypothetical protein
MENIESLFWKKLSDSIREHCSQRDYKSIKLKPFTEKMKNISGNVIYNFLKEDNIYKIYKKDYDPGVSKEDYRVDVAGFYTAYLRNQEKPCQERQSEWILEIALEHENNRDWDKELCKLCYLCANLKVIISYYDCEHDIKELLGKRLRKLGEEKIFIYSKSKWLFVFGPSGEENYGRPFRAFCIDKNLTPFELEISEPIIPEQLNKETPPVSFPEMPWKSKSETIKIVEIK